MDETLEGIGLSADADKRVGKYSGGMKKKLEVATALFPGTKILILGTALYSRLSWMTE